MPKRIWYFCAHVARNVTRHQKDRHLSSPENSHRRKSESELQRRTGQGFPDNDRGPNVQCGWTFHHSPYQMKMIKRHIFSSQQMDNCSNYCGFVWRDCFDCSTLPLHKNLCSVQDAGTRTNTGSFQVKLQDEDDWRPGFLHQSGWLLWDELELWGKCVRCC